ncbi:unnamed protein product [Rotaria sp. Silwood2]|nr:unnamed protein product [Rotaria sp. Silwood2]CAF4331227.1 unnamed protein product [Rotaria sp. Silwood2]
MARSKAFHEKGRPSRLTPRTARHLKRLTTGTNRANANVIAQKLNDSLTQCFSSRTRIAWCKKFQSYTIEDWRRVIFSDESTYYVFKRKNKMMVSRAKSEKLAPDCVQQLTTGDGGKVGIWGAMCEYGKTSAFVYSDNMDSTKYCEVLKNYLIPSIKRLPKEKKYIYQCDLAPWHTSNMVKDQIKKLKINMLEWPPNSSDMNVVEEL